MGEVVYDGGASRGALQVDETLDGLVLTVFDAQGEPVPVTLDASGVRRLRRALVTWERTQAERELGTAREEQP